jgi:ketosteroid isomerase-like protein
MAKGGTHPPLLHGWRGDVAVAFASQQEKSRYGSADHLSGHYHYTNVWLKKDGRWQVVSSHGSRFDTAH